MTLEEYKILKQKGLIPKCEYAGFIFDNDEDISDIPFIIIPLIEHTIDWDKLCDEEGAR